MTNDNLPLLSRALATISLLTRAHLLVLRLTLGRLATEYRSQVIAALVSITSLFVLVILQAIRNPSPPVFSMLSVVPTVSCVWLLLWLGPRYRLCRTEVEVDLAPAPGGNTAESTLDDVLRNVARQPQSFPIEQLFPIVVPASFFEAGNWVGPYEVLDNSAIALTWVILASDKTMVYLSHDMARLWESQGLPWRRRALENLRRATESVWKAEYRRDNGDVYAVVMNHEDGLGPSRLFATAALERVFPDGYEVAVPDMGVAFAVSKSASDEERQIVEEVLNQCHKSGPRPLSPRLFAPVSYGG